MKKLMIFLLLISACTKAEDRTCLKFHGDQTERTVQLDSFTEVEINVHIIVNLIQDTANFAIIRGGKNVIKQIETNVSQGKLVLKNVNKCSYLRDSKKKITVDLHFQSLEGIFYQGSENLECIGTISCPKLKVVIKETSGQVKLNVNTIDFELSAEPSWVNFFIEGSTTNATISAKGNAWGDTRNLLVQNKLICTSRTGGDVYINGSTAHLKCETNGVGNVYYTGTPGFIEWNDYGTGKLLPAP